MATAGRSRGPGPERAFASPLPTSGEVRLDREEGHHLVRVRRARVGDEIVLFDGSGATRLARLADERAEGPTLEIVSDYPDREPSVKVAVAAALPAASRSDDLVAALAELGVHTLVPLSTARGMPDLAPFLERRRSRFERLVLEAAKVNGRSRFLRIEAPRGLAELAAWGGASAEGWAPILLDTDPDAPSLSALVLTVPAPLLVVGPEGGFTDEEIETWRRSGGPVASLGACALRTEAAAAAAAAIALGSGP